jgi:hypothetical protein
LQVFAGVPDVPGSGNPLGLATVKPDTSEVRQLVETLIAELERPREVTAQIFKQLDGSYGVERDAIGEFLAEELPKLEDYEHDLILSPLFTPRLADQAIFAELLGIASIAHKQWPVLVRDLVQRPITAHLVTEADKIYPVILREVSIERFIYRLRLDGTIPPVLLHWIDRTPPEDHPLLKAVARRAIWENRERCEILLHLLKTSQADGTYKLSDAVDLLKLAEDYQPANIATLLPRIAGWIQTLQDEVHAAANPKPFFSAAVQELHGGSDHREKDEARMETKQRDLIFLRRLEQLLTAGA